MSGKRLIHSHALCESKDIGSETKIWPYVHVLPGAIIGNHCNIYNNVFIESDVVIGDRVTIKCGVQIWDGIHIENDVFIGPNATFTNTLFSRRLTKENEITKTIVQQGASIGANTTILPGITIGQSSMIGAGAVVTKSVPPHAVVVGNPARIVGYSSDSISKANELPILSMTKNSNEVIPLEINDCALWLLPNFDDMRGKLMVTEFSRNLPFVPRRCFFVYAVPNNKIRGEHAHKKCEQFLVAISGSVSVVIDNGSKRDEVVLDSPSKGLYMTPCTWGIQYKFSSDAVLCVYASHEYDSHDYIREYTDFLEYIK